MIKGRVVRILNASKRSGQGKNGKPYNIMEVEVEREDGSLIHADSFDMLVDNDQVELKSNSYEGKDGKTYSSWNASTPRGGFGGSKPAADFTEVLSAIRMVFREVKTLEAKVDRLLGEDTEVSEPAPRKAVAANSAPEDNWIPSDDEAAQANVYEDVGDEPVDLSSFMNAQ